MVRLLWLHPKSTKFIAVPEQIRGRDSVGALIQSVRLSSGWAPIRLVISLAPDEAHDYLLHYLVPLGYHRHNLIPGAHPQNLHSGRSSLGSFLDCYPHLGFPINFHIFFPPVACLAAACLAPGPPLPLDNNPIHHGTIGALPLPHIGYQWSPLLTSGSTTHGHLHSEVQMQLRPHGLSHARHLHCSFHPLPLLCSDQVPANHFHLVRNLAHPFLNAQDFLFRTVLLFNLSSWGCECLVR